MDIAKLQLTTFSTKYHSLYAISPNRPYVVVPKKFKSKFHSPFFFSEKDFVQLNDTFGIIEHIIRILFYFKSHIR